MIKIQARMVVIPHTMAVCLIYSSMQAPGLFVPGLSACKVQGLFTFSPGLRKQAAHTFMLRVLDGGLLQLYTPQTPVRSIWKHLFFLSFPCVPLTGHCVAPLSFLLFCCISVPTAGFTFRKRQIVKPVWMSRRAAVLCSRNFFFLFLFVSINKNSNS